MNNRHMKILVAFDGSESSKNALKQAITLGQRENSWIKVLAVVPDYEGDLELIGVSNVKETLKGPTDKLVTEAQAIADSLSADILTDVEQGEAYEKIIDVAGAENCDLIVMGRRGLRRMERMLMGSVTARVISHSDKNVLVVPRDAVIGWDHICLATDGSDYSEIALERAIDYARELDSKLTIASVVDMYPEYYADATNVVDKMDEKAQEVLAEAAGKAQAADVAVDTRLLRGDPAQEVTDLAKKENCGIIFAGSRGRSGLKKLLMGSVAEKIIGLSNCPVFVAKPD
jgi:nucleotide-binding universal stress UspA family protein